jgi:hypothetical protein
MTSWYSDILFGLLFYSNGCGSDIRLHLYACSVVVGCTTYYHLMVLIGRNHGMCDLLVMKGKHHPLELREVYLAVAIFIELLYKLLPIFIRDFFIFISQNVFELTRRDLTVEIQVKQVESLPQMLLCQHLIKVGGCCNKLGILYETIPVQVHLLHDLLKLSLEEHLFPQELFEALPDLFQRQDAILVRIKLLEDG